MTGEVRHACPAVEPGLAGELVGRVRREPWLLGALDAVAASRLPDAWVGAGVLRDVVWGQLHEGFDPAAVRDVDVAFFDAGDLSRECDQAAQARLESLAGLPWEATNQSLVGRRAAPACVMPGQPPEPCMTPGRLRLSALQPGVSTEPRARKCRTAGR